MGAHDRHAARRRRHRFLLRGLEPGRADDQRLALPRRFRRVGGGGGGRGEIDDDIDAGEKPCHVVAGDQAELAEPGELAEILADHGIALGLAAARDAAARGAVDLGDEHAPHAPTAAGDPDRDLRHASLLRLPFARD